MGFRAGRLILDQVVLLALVVMYLLGLLPQYKVVSFSYAFDLSVNCFSHYEY